MQLVESGDGLVLLTRSGEVPLFLHAFTGTDPGADPCSGSEVDPSLWGTHQVVVTDNDLRNEGRRANVFGLSGQGTLQDATGGTWKNAFHWRMLFAPEENAPVTSPPRVLTEEFTLTPTGA